MLIMSRCENLTRYIMSQWGNCTQVNPVTLRREPYKGISFHTEKNLTQVGPFTMWKPYTGISFHTAGNLHMFVLHTWENLSQVCPNTLGKTYKGKSCHTGKRYTGISTHTGDTLHTCISCNTRGNLT